MNYRKGTIVFIERTKFADNGRYDNKGGHPSMLPIATDDISEEIYYLMLTSNTGRINIYPDMYYDLSDCWEELHLIKPSLINLQQVYTTRVCGNTLGGMPPKLYKDVMRELKRYQEEHPCENYEKIKNKI